MEKFQIPSFLKEGFFCDNFFFLEDYLNFILPRPLQRRGASGLIPEGVSLLKEGNISTYKTPFLKRRAFFVARNFFFNFIFLGSLPSPGGVPGGRGG